MYNYEYKTNIVKCMARCICLYIRNTVYIYTCKINMLSTEKHI